MTVALILTPLRHGGLCLAAILLVCSCTPSSMVPIMPDSPAPVSAMQVFEAKAMPGQAVPRISVVNLHGGVKVQRSESSTATLELWPFGEGPREVRYLEDDGVATLYLLDAADAIEDRRPECPVVSSEGKVFRIGEELARCDVVVHAPRNAIVDIRACAWLELDADVIVRARCGGAVTILGGTGSLQVEAVSLRAQTCNWEIRGDIATDAMCTGTIGGKALRCGGDLRIVGGGGWLDLDASGSAYIETAISGGTPRTAGWQGHADADIVGGSWPDLHEPARSGASRSSSRIRARTVQLRMRQDSNLEVVARASEGSIKLGVDPSARNVITHEYSGSTAHLSLGAPDGELSIEAREEVTLIVMP